MVEFNWKWRFLLKQTSKNDALVQIWPNFVLNWTILDMNRSNFDINARIRIVATISMHFSNKFGLKKSIKSWFEYDLDRILAGGWSNRISLFYTCMFLLKVFGIEGFQDDQYNMTNQVVYKMTDLHFENTRWRTSYDT